MKWALKWALEQALVDFKAEFTHIPKMEEEIEPAKPLSVTSLLMAPQGIPDSGQKWS